MLQPRGEAAAVCHGVLDPYIELITETLSRYPTVCSTRLYDMLCERGYTGSVRQLRRYVSAMRPRRVREAFLRTEPLIGEQAQVDWAHVGHIKVPGGERALWVFVMVLAWSRAMWAELVLDLTVHSVRRSMVRAIHALGGSTRQWLFDNPKTIVLERLGDAVRFHPAMLDLGGHYHAQLRVCGVRKPQQKGRVERAVRFLRDRFFAARSIGSVEMGNQQLTQWLSQIAHARPHPVQHARTVSDCLAEERERLLVLPSAPAVTDQVLSVHVDKTATVRFETNFYSVPPAHVGQTLTLVAGDTLLRLLDGSAEVTEHTRCWGRRQLVEVVTHREEILAMKRAGRDLKGRDRLRCSVPQIDALMLRWLHAGRNMGSVVGRTVKLLDLYGDAVLVAAVAEMIERGTEDFGALAVLCEKHRRVHERPVPIDLEFGAHVPERDVIPHDLEGYDARTR
jgi:transposase